MNKKFKIFLIAALLLLVLSDIGAFYLGRYDYKRHLKAQLNDLNSDEKLDFN